MSVLEVSIYAGRMPQALLSMRAREKEGPKSYLKLVNEEIIDKLAVVCLFLLPE